MRDIRHVIVHRPGPLWKAGLPSFQQEGVQQHIEHFRQWLDAGKLALGGPFLDAAAGGMMIRPRGSAPRRSRHSPKPIRPSCPGCCASTCASGSSA